MKAYEEKKLLKYILKYISQGRMLGYFNDTQSDIIYRKLSNLDIRIDNRLDKVLKIDREGIVLNLSKLNDDKESSFEVFKVFTSIISGLYKGTKENNDVDNPNIFLRAHIKTIMMDYFGTQFDTSYKQGNKIYSSEDLNNPYLYCVYGFNLLNEVISQMIATNMSNSLFKLRNQKKKYVRNYSYPSIEYLSSFEYCGIGEIFIDSISKNIFGLKNTTGLCKEIFKTNFLNNFFKDLLNDEERLLKTFKLLSHLGVLYHCEEMFYGKKFNKVPLDKKMVCNSYREIKSVLSDKLNVDEIKKSR